MSISDSLMARLGYVKLGRYGLALTPQGRIITTQPAILDDGSGGRIVGWQRGDLAELQLASLPVGRAEPPAPIPVAPVRTFAHTVPVTPVARAVPPPTPVVVQPTPVQVAKLALSGIAEFSAPTMPPVPPESNDVVGEADDDDDWDWQMAVARARAAAEETEAAVVAKPPPRLSAPVTPPPAALTAPTGVRVTPPPVPMRAPKMTAPVIRDSSMVPARAPAKPAAPNVVPLRAASTAPSTRPAPLPPRRAARGTGQLGDDPATAKIAIAPAPRPAQTARPSMPLAPPTEDTAVRRAPVAPARRAGPAPAPSFPRLEPIPVEDTRPDTRTEIKPAPLPRFTTRFAAAR